MKGMDNNAALRLNLALTQTFKKWCLATTLALFCSMAQGQAPGSSLGETPTWAEAQAAFTALHAQFPDLTQFSEFGTSDVGRPLNLFTMGPEDAALKILINNAIHPGEPCGVNASIAWATSLLAEGRLSKDVCIGIVPMYNVGGGLRRNCCSRANQNGPAEYGFRGNARNLDLNRDFIKCDSRNALAFNAMFTSFGPDIFVDTHTSNGADYPAEMTLIATQPDKLGGPLGEWLEHTLVPELYSEMDNRGSAMVPYVYSLEDTPDSGIQDFLETPRYSTGYAALHHAIGFTSEAHMLKPFPDRVAATLRFLESVLECGIRHKDTLHLLRNAQAETYTRGTEHAVSWTLDKTATDSLLFTGYTARYEWSNVSGERRLRYDRQSPWTEYIPHLHTYKATSAVRVPAAFIVPQAWRHVIERLQANGISFTTCSNDTTLVVEVAHILEHTAAKRPYEGHHYRTVSKIDRRMEMVQLFEGDLILPLDQPAARYLLETLSPEGVDAFLAWNFFDSALQQKEYFSSYVFEETAAKLLQEDPALQEDLAREKAKMETDGMEMGGRRQLDFIYQRSKHAEGTANRYPIFSIPAGQPVPFQ